ncbi:MAG: aminotransferase class IV [Alphaproteobacteria bacterium]|nr:aminotransferase class IV [Alphaproteobacteria bacterium]
MFVSLSGQLCHHDEASISITDRGFLLGDGFFTTVLSVDGVPEHFQAHGDRLRKSADLFRIPLVLDTLWDQVLRLLDANQLMRDLAAIRITVTRGAGGRGLCPPKGAQPTLLITAIPYNRPTTPVRVGISMYVRDSTPPLCHVKHLGYQTAILARIEGEEKGYDDMLLCNKDGNLVCSTAGNLFLIVDGEILTPPLTDGALPGIMRAEIIRSRTVKIQQITRDLYKIATGAFITNSLVGMQMISGIESCQLYPI